MNSSIQLQTAAILFSIEPSSKTGYWLGVCHGWFHLQGLTGDVKNASWVRITKLKSLAHCGIRTRDLPFTKRARYHWATKTGVSRVDKRSPGFTRVIFRNLPVARFRCSKIICRLFCHLIFVSFCCLPIKKFADSKEFTKCNSRKIILLHLPSATGKFLNTSIAQVKTWWTFIHSVDISLCSSVVARSLGKREVPGSNPTVGMNFTFCNSRSTRDPHSSSKPMRMKSTMTYT